MNQQELVNWLFENGGPAIRYRTATELMPPSGNINTGQLIEELLQSQLVKTWLERFTPVRGINSLHSSKSTAFENVVGKLTDLGCRHGMAELDRQTRPFRQWLQDNIERPPRNIQEGFVRRLIAAFLARAGYTDDPVVGTVLKNRLETISDFTRQGSYDIYVDPADYERMPRSFQKKPLVNPALTRDGNSCLPSIYDIIGLAAYLPQHGTEDDQIRFNTIINYILNDRYQKLHPGYGILRTEDRRYYAMGWSVWLPGFFGEPSLDTRPGRSTPEMLGAFIQRLVLMGEFPTTREHPWFINNLNHLEGFRTGNGTYQFPRAYLTEKPVGYWVAGARMALEENRRKALAIELESTFWMAKLKALLSTEGEMAVL